MFAGLPPTGCCRLRVVRLRAVTICVCYSIKHPAYLVAQDQASEDSVGG